MDLLAELDGLVSLSARYALAIFPYDFDSHLISAAATVNIPFADTVAAALGPAYTAAHN